MKKLITICLIWVMAHSQVSAAILAKDDLPPDVRADLEAELEALGSDLSIENCKATLVPLYDYELAEFFKYLDTSFQNKAANSQIINFAIARYSEYKQNVEGHFLDRRPLFNDQAVEDFDSQLQAFSECSALTELYLDLAKDQMIRHIRSTNSAKNTTVMLEKYQAINSQLRELNIQMAQMYSHFLAFKNKLPAFVRSCLGA